MCAYQLLVVSPHRQARQWEFPTCAIARCALIQQILDLSRKSMQNWEMGGQTTVDPLHETIR